MLIVGQSLGADTRAAARKRVGHSRVVLRHGWGPRLANEIQELQSCVSWRGVRAGDERTSPAAMAVYLAKPGWEPENGGRLSLEPQHQPSTASVSLAGAFDSRVSFGVGWQARDAERELFSWID